MANSHAPPQDAYRALMAYSLVALDKRPGEYPIGKGETLRQAITKVVMRAEGYQANMGFDSLQLWSGLDTGIEGETQAVAQRRQESNALLPEEREDG